MKRSSATLLLLLSTSLGAAFGAENPRAARSVHLAYQAPPSVSFYSEMTIKESVEGSYFMAAGFNRGYFGLQELWGGRKIALFSVWDPDEGNRPQDVAVERQVEVLGQGRDVTVRRFGGEGTGAQCLRSFDWKLGETYRFIVTAHTESNRTTFTGRFYDPASTNWIEMATFRTITGGHALDGHHSFVEDFRRDGRSVQERRSAVFGNLWVQTPDATWRPIRRAQFSADGNVHTNIDAGSISNRVYLATGGATTMSRELWSHIEVTPGEAAPSDLPTRAK